MTTTDQELLSLPRVGPEEAAEYLGGEPSAHYIRLWCQSGKCPFGAALQTSNRWNYTINRQRLIRYRRGEVPPAVPEAVLSMIESLIQSA